MNKMQRMVGSLRHKFAINEERIVGYYQCYVGAHVIAGGGLGAVSTVCAVKEDGFFRCIFAPFAIGAGGFFGFLAGVVPGMTPIAACILLCNSKK